MANTYTLIASYTATSTQASYTFSSIPSTYTDLKLLLSMRDADTNGALASISFEGVTTNLSSIRLRGTGSAATSSTFSSNIYVQNQANGETANTFSNVEVYIPNYRSSQNKSVSSDGVSENNATAAYMQLTAGLWANTSTISSITITPAVPNFQINSTFYLYGIKNS